VRPAFSLRLISRISDAMLEGVYLDPEGRQRHLKAVRAMRPQRDHVFEHDYLYSCLTILDTKAQALLAYDGILMAAAAISLSLFSHDISPGSVAVFSSLAASSLSSILCLHVIWIYWTDTVELENSGNLFDTLLRVRNRRTLAYRMSWLIAQASALLLISGVVLDRKLP